MNGRTGSPHKALVATLGVVALALLIGFYAVVSNAVQVSAARHVAQSAVATTQHRPRSMPAPRLALAGSPGHAD